MHYKRCWAALNRRDRRRTGSLRRRAGDIARRTVERLVHRAHRDIQGIAHPLPHQSKKSLGRWSLSSLLSNTTALELADGSPYGLKRYPLDQRFAAHAAHGHQFAGGYCVGQYLDVAILRTPLRWNSGIAEAAGKPCSVFSRKPKM